MKRLFLLLPLLLVSCDDRYRYPCQDPDNFGKPECTPPACEADGTCTEFLIGRPLKVYSGDNSGFDFDGDCGSSLVLPSVCNTASQQPSSE